MKKLALLALVLLVGCAGLSQQTVSICDRPENADSWICEKSKEIGVQPETVYGWIFSASAIAAIKDSDNIRVVCDFEKEIADWYDQNYPISYDAIINYAIKRLDLMEPTKAILIKNVMNRNLIVYRNVILVRESDDRILRMGHRAFRQDMLCD